MYSPGTLTSPIDHRVSCFLRLAACVLIRRSTTKTMRGLSRETSLFYNSEERLLLLLLLLCSQPKTTPEETPFASTYSAGSARSRAYSVLPRLERYMLRVACASWAASGPQSRKKKHSKKSIHFRPKQYSLATDGEGPPARLRGTYPWGCLLSLRRFLAHRSLEVFLRRLLTQNWTSKEQGPS